jgi:hypothetical protein
MVDNVGYTPGTGATIAADDIGGVLYQRVKPTFGVDNSAVDVSASNPLPVTGDMGITGSVAVTGTFFQATQPVSGTVTANAGTGTFAISAASLPLPTGASTAALQSTINTTLGSPFQAGGSIGNTAFGISGTLPAFAATPTVNLGTLNGAATAAKQPALGTAGTPSADVLTVQGVTSMTALKVDGSAVTQPVSGTVTANAGTGTFAVSGPLTDTQLRASAVPVSGTVTANAGTGTFTISGTVTANAGTGTFAISAASLPLPTGAATSANQPTAAAAASTTSGQTGALIMGAVTTAAPTYTTAQTNPISLTTLGGQRCDVSSYNGTALTGTVTAYGTAPTGNVFGVNAAITSGTLTTVTTVTTCSTVTTLANGQTAHSSASTGSPVRVAGRVNTAVDTTLVAGDVSDVFMTTGGAATIKPYAVPEVDWQATSGLTPLATTTSTAVKVAGAAGVRNYVTAIQLVNNSATVSTNVAILDGATVLWAGWLPATTAALPVVPVNINFPTPLRGTAATAVNIQLGTTSASVFWNAQGYQAP